MIERYYEIQLKTPLGIKHGSMLVRIRKEQLNGCLDVMKHSEAFAGTITSDGRCRFSGNLISLMRVIPYEAEGVIDECKVELSLKGERNVFYITGTVWDNKNN